MALAVALAVSAVGVVFGLLADLRYPRRAQKAVVPDAPVVLGVAADPVASTEATAPVAPPAQWAPTVAPPVAPPPTVAPTVAPPVTPPPVGPQVAPPAPVPEAHVAPAAPTPPDPDPDPEPDPDPDPEPALAVASPPAPPAAPMPAVAAVPARPAVTATPPRAPSQAALLECEAVDVAYGQVRVLFGVDLEVGPDEIVALLGTNGAGKSTLLKAVSGVVDPIGGTIRFDGRDITHADPVTRAKLGIVQVPGGRAVFPTLTVAEHFKAAGWLFSRESHEEATARTDRVLDMFPRLRDRWDQMGGNLSGGEQQQLGLSMAFVAKPRLLIIDELSLGLSPIVVEQLLEIVKAIHAEGCPVILVEQSVNVALGIASRAYFMEKGEVRFQGATTELLARPDVLRSVFLEGASNGGRGSPADPIRVSATARRPPVAGGPGAEVPALSVAGLSKRFGGISAVEDVSFDLRHGEVLGLIGPNGAGKTTVFDLVSGVVPPDGGRIRLQGADVTGWRADRRAAQGLGRSFQDARIFPSLTVNENIALGLDRHVEVRDHFAALLDLPAVQESERRVRLGVDELVELMGLQAYRDKFVSELSTGVRRIVDLAMAIGHEPTVLLLDEPSSGIAQRETEALGPLLKRIQKEIDCSLLVIEHDMPLVAAVADEILALDLGEVVMRGTPAEVMSDPRVVASYLGGDLSAIQRSGAAAPAY